MTRVLLTGGSGYIASHILEYLLERGHSVVTTVRSQAKADAIRKAHAGVGQDRLDFAIVEDVAQEGAFDKAVVSSPPFEAVLHTASPFHFNVTDVQKELLDPAVIGTTGILRSIKQNAPDVKRVVITSSFAAIVDSNKGNWPEHTYSEADWNPITHEQALSNPSLGYRGSKTFAERAAWEFVEKEKPSFTLSTINPPLVFGPCVKWLNSLDALNTSNERVRDIIQGKMKEEIAPTATFLWVDVRDVALCHVHAMERDDAQGKRFFATNGKFSNREMVKIIRDNFPEYQDAVPGPDVPGGDYPEGGSYGYDSSKARELLGRDYYSLEKSVIDLVKSLQDVGA